MYTVEDPPEFLKSLPKGAIRVGVDVFNAVLKETKDEERARIACWSAIKAKFEKGEDGEWRAKEGLEGRESPRTIRFRAARQADDAGLAWEAILIAPGLSLSSPRFYWSDEVLAEAASLFQGVDICAYELTAEFFAHLPIPTTELMEDVKRYLTSRKVGWIEKSEWQEGVGIVAEIRFLPDAGRILEAIKYGLAQQNGEVMGLSIDARVKGVTIVVDGWEVIWVTKIVSASSVDVVTHPAAGGKFLRAIAGLDKPQTKEGNKMDREKLLNLIQQLRPDLLNGKDRAAMSDDQVMELARMAMTPPASPARSTEEEKRAAQAIADQITAEMKKATDAIEQRAACARMLDTALAVPTVPPLMAARIRRQFANRVFTQEDLDKAVKDEKDYAAAMAAPDMILMVGDQTRMSGGLGTLDRIQMSIDRTFGLTKENMETFARMEKTLNAERFRSDRYGGAQICVRAAQDYAGFEQVPRFKGLMEMYVALTGDTDVSGFFNRKNLPADLRAAQDMTASTFTYALGNTLARMLVTAFRRPDYGQDILIGVRKAVKDFRQQEAVKIGGFAKLETVNTDTGDYQEISAVTDEESTYTVTEHGNILTFSRRFMLNDDIGLMKRLVDALGLSAVWTLADFVWAFWRDNSNCSDGTAWHTSGHGNLGSSALTIATAYAAEQALAKMTEKDSGRRLGLLDDMNVKPYLVHPPDLSHQAAAVANNKVYYTANDLTTETANPLFERVIPKKVSLLTDTSDWGLLLPASVVPHIEIGFLQGREEPELVVADSPQSEQTFVGNRIRYRISHDYSGAVVPFEGSYKAQV